MKYIDFEFNCYCPTNPKIKVTLSGNFKNKLYDYLRLPELLHFHHSWAVLQRLRQVGNGAAELEDAVVSQRRKLQLIYGGAHECQEPA